MQIFLKVAEMQWEHCILRAENVEQFDKNGNTLEAIRPEMQKLSFNVVRVICWSNADQLLS